MTVWQMGFAGFMLVAGYLSGFQHGGDRVSRDLSKITAPIEVAVESPFSNTCAVMLEAAWAIEDVPSVE